MGVGSGNPLGDILRVINPPPLPPSLTRCEPNLSKLPQELLYKQKQDSTLKIPDSIFPVNLLEEPEWKVNFILEHLEFVPVNLSLFQRIKEIFHNFFRLECVNKALARIGLSNSKKIVRVLKTFKSGTDNDTVQLKKGTTILGGDKQDELLKLLMQAEKVDALSRKTDIVFCNNDTITAAYNSGSDVIVNVANRRRPGEMGFCFYGDSQAGDLVRRSNLLYGINLKKNKHLATQKKHKLGQNVEHHIPYYGSIYSPAVTFLDEKGSKREKKLDVISCAVVDLRKGSDESKYFKGNKDLINRVNAAKIKAILASALIYGKRKIVVGPVGWDAFKNDPGTIAKLFKEALDTTFKNKFEQVVFAIKEPEGKEEKLNIFKKVFKSL